MSSHLAVSLGRAEGFSQPSMIHEACYAGRITMTLGGSDICNFFLNGKIVNRHSPVLYRWRQTVKQVRSPPFVISSPILEFNSMVLRPRSVFTVYSQIQSDRVATRFLSIRKVYDCVHKLQMKKEKNGKG